MCEHITPFKRAFRFASTLERFHRIPTYTNKNLGKILDDIYFSVREKMHKTLTSQVGSMYTNNAEATNPHPFSPPALPPFPIVPQLASSRPLQMPQPHRHRPTASLRPFVCNHHSQPERLAPH